MLYLPLNITRFIDFAVILNDLFMKINLFLFCILASALFAGCSEGKKEKEIKEMTPLERESYIDSLVNVATGINGVSKPLNRKNALEILRKEYPSMNDKWDRCEECIDNFEIYSEE